MALGNTREVLAKLEGLVSEVDNLENGFDRNVEPSRMSLVILHLMIVQGPTVRRDLIISTSPT